MHQGIIIAGFGGQGIILAGKMICIAAMHEGKHVSHIPSYGAEMRGGTANCAVVVSDEEIASPLVPKPSICIVMNKPSLLKFEGRLQEGGLLIYNTTLIDLAPSRSDIEAVPIAANDLAVEAGNIKAANMVVLGLLLKLKPEIAALDSVIAALDEAVSARNKALNAINTAALKLGYS
ncbi:NADH-dependent phenylglyoxylate dehydrogenase subunit gamma [subsurface metagenome]